MADVKVEKDKYQVMDEKLAKGEKLTPDEEKDLMSEPNEQTQAPVIPEDDFDEPIEEPKKAVKETPKKETPKEEIKEPVPVPEKKEQDDLDLVKLEAELAKAEGTETLDGFTKREQAYFWQMRRERRARQKAEEERDAVRFQVAKEKAQPKEETPQEEPDPFKERDPGDFITVEDAKKLLQATKARAEKPKQEVPPPDPIRVNYLRMCDQQAADKFKEDYQEVMECAEEILGRNPYYIKEMGQAIQRGENPAIVAYHLIKGDPEFPRLVPLAQARVKGRNKAKEEPVKETPKANPEHEAKVAEAKAVEEKVETNNNKSKTSAHVSSGESESGEYSGEDIMKMSDRQFAKLPKKVREGFLRKYGI